MRLVKITDIKGDCITITAKIEGFVHHKTKEFLEESKCDIGAQITRLLTKRKYMKFFVSYCSVHVVQHEIISEYGSEFVEKEYMVFYLSDDYWINEYANNFNEHFDKIAQFIELEIAKETNDAEIVSPTMSEIVLFIHDIDDELE